MFRPFFIFKCLGILFLISATYVLKAIWVFLPELLSNHLYSANHNSFPLPYWGKIPLMYFVYFSIALLGTIFIIFQLMVARRGRLSWNSLLGPLPKAAFLSFIVTIGFQTYSQSGYWVKRHAALKGKNQEQKLSLIIGDSFYFSQFCLTRLKGQKQGQFITDVSMYQTSEPYYISYRLYPAVDLVTQYEDAGCIIVYEKSNPQKYLPENYSVVGTYNSKSLVAVK